MARLSRIEIFAPDEIAIVHFMNRTVRRCFLLGNDPLTGKNHDHQKLWLDKELKRLAAQPARFESQMRGNGCIRFRSKPNTCGTNKHSETSLLNH